MKKASKIIAIVLILLLLAGVIGAVLVFTNGGNEDFKTFYIERDGKKILTSETTEAFHVKKPVKYTVHYTFDVASSEKKDYIVKILPNTAQSFDYTVDGKKYAWKGLDENALTKKGGPFVLKKEADSFTLSFAVDYERGMQDVLESLYPEKEVVLPDGLDPRKPYFTLYVASYNEAVKFFIRFSLESETGLYVTLDNTEIIF